MLRYLLISVFCTLLFLNCSGEQQKEESSDVQMTTDQDAAVMADCSGDCGMTMEKSKMIMEVEEGDTLYFCSEKCQEKYMAKEAAEEEEGEDTDTGDES